MTSVLAAAFLLLQEDVNAKAREALATECGLDFTGKKVSEVLMQLSQTQLVCFAPDPRSAPKTREQEAKTKKTGTIGEVLKDILAPHKLTYTTWEGAVIVGTAEALKEFDGGKVSIIGAKERGAKDLPEWKKELYAALEAPVQFDLLAGFRTGEKAEKPITMGFQWISEIAKVTFAYEGGAQKACGAISTLQVENASAAVAIALLARQAGCTVTADKGKTVRIRK